MAPCLALQVTPTAARHERVVCDHAGADLTSASSGARRARSKQLCRADCINCTAGYHSSPFLHALIAEFMVTILGSNPRARLPCGPCQPSCRGLAALVRKPSGPQLPRHMRCQVCRWCHATSISGFRCGDMTFRLTEQEILPMSGLQSAYLKS